MADKKLITRTQKASADATDEIYVIDAAGTSEWRVPITGMNGYFVWNDITGDPTMLNNNGYLTNGAGERQLTLPATSILGDEIKIATGTSTWKVLQAVNQKITMGDEVTTTGITGYLQSDGEVTLLCTQANLNWKVIANQGIFTIN